MSNYKVGVLKLPEHMHGGVLRYLEDGIKPGDFLYAVFTNDLKETYRQADDINVYEVRAYVNFMYNYMPIESVGSKDRVFAWVASGGLNGYKKTFEDTYVQEGILTKSHREFDDA